VKKSEGGKAIGMTTKKNTEGGDPNTDFGVKEREKPEKPGRPVVEKGEKRKKSQSRVEGERRRARV